MVKKCMTAFCIAGVIGLFSGCDPLTTHKITSTIFDGVPSMPPAEQYCQEYHQRTVAEEAEAELKKQLKQAKSAGSIHPPYAQKHCDQCHNKDKESGFVVPVRELCGVCHKNFIKGRYVHGPAAIGSCLECHVPHNSPNPYLLKNPPDQVCAVCHQEQRLAAKLHDTVKEKGLTCTSCHNPHSGNARFFLE